MVGELSTRSKSVGNVVHRLTQRRQPWQMSKMRPSSFSALAWSQNSGFFQSSGCRVGASSEPSLMGVSVAPAKAGAQDFRKCWVPAFAGATSAYSVGEAVERLLALVGVASFGLGKCLEPVGDLGEAVVARLLRHAGVHVGVFVRL